MFVYKCFDLSVVIFPPHRKCYFYTNIQKRRKKIHVINFVALELGKNDELKWLFLLSEKVYKGCILNYTSIWFLFS